MLLVKLRMLSINYNPSLKWTSVEFYSMSMLVCNLTLFMRCICDITLQLAYFSLEIVLIDIYIRDIQSNISTNYIFPDKCIDERQLPVSHAKHFSSHHQQIVIQCHIMLSQRRKVMYLLHLQEFVQIYGKCPIYAALLFLRNKMVCLKIDDFISKMNLVNTLFYQFLEIKDTISGSTIYYLRWNFF